MHRFYASPESFTDDAVTLDGDETRHLRDVLRLQPGSDVFVFDGQGKEFKCSVDQIEKKRSLVRIIDQIAPASPESTLELSLAAAILKGDKTDLVIQKAVELGVTEFTPLRTVRGDVKQMAVSNRTQRWRRIALEATKQSGRARLMAVNEPVDLKHFIAQSEVETVVLFSERDGGPFPEVAHSAKITAVFGPEGGWDDLELDLARASRAMVVTLGGRILRAETAAISIAAILQHRFGDLN